MILTMKEQSSELGQGKSKHPLLRAHARKYPALRNRLLTKCFRDYSASSDLNSDPNHFLLELLQNAEDNQYAAEDPTLSLTYTTDKHLKTYCNEKGFTQKDVSAIVGLRESTKTGSLGTTGEKASDSSQSSALPGSPGLPLVSIASSFTQILRKP